MPSFRPAGTDVAHERVEDEVIAINLATGAYFSLAGTAADCWTLLAAGADATAVAATVAERYDARARHREIRPRSATDPAGSGGAARRGARDRRRSARTAGADPAARLPRPDARQVRRHGGALAARPDPRGRRGRLAARAVGADGLDVPVGAAGYAERLSAGFEEAAAAVGLQERSHRLGGHVVRLRFAGDEMTTRLGAAFAHLDGAQAGDPAALTISAWIATAAASPRRPRRGASRTTRRASESAASTTRGCE